MRFPDPVRLVNAGPPTVDEDTGNDVPGADVPTDTVGLLQPMSTSTEAGDGTQTVIAKWVLLLPPGSPCTSSTVVEAAGGRYEVVGDPAPLSTGAGIPSHIHLTLNRVSDLQPEPEESP